MPNKLKRARGCLGRAIKAELIEAPPGYMTAEDIEREDAAKAAAKTKQGRKLSPYEEMLLD
jgi:hypothetical protein